MRRFGFVLFLVALTLLSACGHTTRNSEDIRLSTRLTSTFGISLPCSLVWCGGYLDGGSTGGLIVDTKADSLKFAWGRRVHSLSVPKMIMHDSVRVRAWEDSVLKSPPTLAYVGADHILKPEARPLTVGSSSESLFIQLLWYVAGSDTTLVRGRGTQKRFIASNVARALQRQRLGLTPLRRWGDLSPSERSAMTNAK